MTHQLTTTIVVTSYNYAQYLEECLHSAVAQTAACRVVVVDDGSTDASREILKRWQDRVDVVLQDNQGQRGAYTTGLANCDSDIVIFLDSDDLLDAGAVQQVTQAFADPSIVKVHYPLRLISQDSQPLNGQIPRNLDQGDLYEDYIRSGVAYLAAPGSGNAYRRSALMRLFPLPVDPKDRHAADFFCIYGIVALGRVAALSQPCGSYRVHAAASSIETTPLLFGNSESMNTLEQKLSGRALGLADLLARVTGQRPDIHGRLIEFSEEKTIYASRVFQEPWGPRRWAVAVQRMPGVVKAVRARRSERVSTQVALVGWALAIALLPTRLGRLAASLVCNPAVRARWLHRQKALWRFSS